MGDDWSRVRTALAAAEVQGSDDFGHFVSNTKHFAPTQLDERAAMPTLLAVLPTLADPRVVAAAAGHLRRPWARSAAFDPLLDAYAHWALVDATTAWALGDALGCAAAKEHVSPLLTLVQEQQFGTSRQMIVHHLARFRSDPEVGVVVATLVDDPTVALQAMSTLRRCLGNEEALPTLERLASSHPDQNIRALATAAAKKARKALS